MKVAIAFSILFICLLFSASPALAEDDTAPIEVVVTANKIETPLDEIASSISVVTGDEITERQRDNVADVLKTVRSVDVVRSGGQGGNESIFIRGANAEHTLLLIDGIEANNPISTSRLFNFADLATDNIERIEVLRGPQSTLYGSDAMGGVINIITKKGQGDPAGFVSSQGGSYSSFTERAGLSGGTDSYDYSFGASREDTNGISAAGAKYGNTEHDGHSNNTLSARLGAKFDKQLGAQFFFRGFSARNDLDDAGGIGEDDPNRKMDDDDYLGRAEVNTDLLDGALQQTIGYSLTSLRLKDNSDPSEMQPMELLRSRYDGGLQKADLKNIIKFSEELKLLAGAETKVEVGKSHYYSESIFGPYQDDFSRRTLTTNGYYSELQGSFFDHLYPTAGVRFDDNSRAGSKVTWRVAPALLFRETGTKLTATVGTAFKAPSLFQLYSSYGNVDLKPEESLGWDTGIEQTLIEKKLLAGVSLFRNNFNHLITFNPDTLKSENINKAKTRGVETYLEWYPCESLSERLSYTYMDTEDNDTGLPLLRRARNKFSSNLTWKPADELHISLETTYTGAREDSDYSTFPATRVRLGGYTLFNVAASYDLTKNLEVFTKVDNLFDKEYEDVFGFGELGVAAYGGVKVKF